MASRRRTTRRFARPGRPPTSGLDRAASAETGRLRGQLVQDLAVDLGDGPAIDERVGHAPDRRLQPDGQFEVPVGRLQPGLPQEVSSPALEIGRPPERLEQVTIQEIPHGKTRMSIESEFPTVEAMEQLAAMGMEEGLKQAVGQIDAILTEDPSATRGGL